MFIEAKDDGGGEWWQLDYWSYNSCKAPVKSSPPTNQHPVFFFYFKPDALPVKALKGKISHPMDLLTPSSPGGLPTLSLTTNSSWLPWGRVAMPLIMGFGGLDLGVVRVCFYPLPPIMSHSFIQNCCWITLQVSHHRGRKSCVKKWKLKLIFRGPYRLPGTGIVECLEIVAVGCNLKQFDGLTWQTLTPYFMTDLRLWQIIIGNRLSGQWFWVRRSRCSLCQTTQMMLPSNQGIFRTFSDPVLMPLIGW